MENGTKINPGKSKEIRFTTARVKNPLGYHMVTKKFRNRAVLGMILRNNLHWADKVNYTAQKGWKELHFVKRVLKKGNENNKVYS